MAQTFRFPFAKKLLESLPTPATRTYYYDTKQRHLVLTVFPSGQKSFALYRRVNGRPERIAIGRFPDLTIEQARSEAQKLNGEIAAGRNPAEERRAVRVEMTLEQFFSDYVENYGKSHKKTWQNDVSMFNLHLDSLRQRRISEITKGDLVALHRRIGSRAPYQANRVLELLSSMYNRARNESGLKLENPCTGIKPFPEHARERFLDGDELPRFFRALAEEKNVTVRDFILVSLLTGARRSYVQNMEWQEIRWGRAAWEVPAHKSKNKKPMMVQLVPLVIELLERRRDSPDADSTFVFPGGRGYHLAGSRNAWKRILKRAGLRDVRLHDLRRTLGSWQALQGTSLAIIGASLGHKSLSATQVYARLNSDPVYASVLRATNAMLEAAPAGLLPEAKGGRA